MTEKTPKSYEAWKKIAWKFARVFVAASLVSIAANLERINSVNDVLSLLLIPAATAGLVAVAKSIREYVASGDYTNLIHKMPL